MIKYRLPLLALALTLLPAVAYGPAQAAQDEDLLRSEYHLHRNWSKGSPLELGIAELQQGRFEQAARLLQLAVYQKPNDVDANLYLAQAYIDMGNGGQARPYLQAALRVDPGNLTATNLLGQVQGTLASNGYTTYAASETDPAAVALENQIQANPGDASAHYRLAQYFLSNGRNEEAAGELRQVISLQPANADAHFNLGVAYAKLDQWVAAEREIDAALSVRPYFPEASAWLQKVRLHQSM